MPKQKNVGQRGHGERDLGHGKRDLRPVEIHASRTSPLGELRAFRGSILRPLFSHFLPFGQGSLSAQLRRSRHGLVGPQYVDTRHPGYKARREVQRRESALLGRVNHRYANAGITCSLNSSTDRITWSTPKSPNANQETR